MQTELREIVLRADQELRLPSSALRVLELTENVSTKVEDLVRAIEIDPIFSAHILKLANSSVYSRGLPTTDLERAIGVLGFREIGMLAVVLSAAKKLTKIETELLRTTSFWNHSLTTAVLARSTAKTLKIKDRGIFAAALLHDFAMPIQIGMCTEEMREALDLSLFSEEVDLLMAENQLLGFDHTALGSQLFESWGLPEIIVEAAKHHHDPGSCRVYQQEIAIIAWANIIEHLGTDADPEDIGHNQAMMTEIGKIVPLEFPDNDDLLIQAQLETAEMIGMF